LFASTLHLSTLQCSTEGTDVYYLRCAGEGVP